ncbi:Mce family protein MceE [Nocardia nova SH22a]|uniref:Mce family protein MceE n=1 Tax=Nocardia nova SH22a TaxID=1415166 RepID=W5TQP4_9NOCA|nr:MlaD family protein [Nocardia nova]AHH19566.1 Mce family protein MceE [Nocardia nova SH22a]
MSSTFPVARRICAAAAAAATIAVSATACGFQPADIPVPGTGVGGPTYHLRIEFADVLNLPQGAKVIADGVRVGQLTGVTLVNPVPGTATAAARPGYVIADVAIRTSVRLPLGTTAQLRQATPLGDVHIALTEPAAPATGDIAPDATIPLADTRKQLPIEDILSQLATFVGSGAVNDVQNIVHNVNGIMPKDPAVTARISDVLGSDLGDLAAHTDSIHQLVSGIQATVDDGLLNHTSTWDPLLTPDGVQHTTDVISAEIGVVFVLTALGPFAPSTKWLGPVLDSTAGAARAVVPMLFGSAPLDTGSPSNMGKLIDLIQGKIIPFADSGPKIDLVGVGVSPPPDAGMNPEEQTGRIVDTLRMIGAVR